MSHSHLTMEERIRIEVFVSEGWSCRKIARHLGRYHTTIARELHRGQFKERLSRPEKAQDTAALSLYESARADRLGR